MVRARRSTPFLVLALALSPAVGAADSGPLIHTLAGGGVGDNRPGLETHLTGVLSIAADAAGNVYWTENNHLVGAQRARMWDATTGRVRTIAGTGLQKSEFEGPLGDGGPATQAFLHNPFGIAADSKGNVFIYDTGNGRIRRVDAVTGVITKIADTYSPDSSPIHVDAQDRLLWGTGSTVERWDPATGTITRIAGGGRLPLDGQPATEVSIGAPQDIETDPAGNIYLSDAVRVRMIDTQGIIQTLAGGTAAQLTQDGQYGMLTRLQSGSHDLLWRSDGSLWFTDGSAMRRLSPAPEMPQLPGTRRVSTVFAWTGGHADGPLDEADFGWIGDVDALPGGGFVVADIVRVRAVTDGEVSTLVGTGLAPWYRDDAPDVYDWTGDGGPATEAHISDPCAVAAAPDGDVLVSSGGFHSRVRRADAATGLISTIAGTDARGTTGDGGPATEARLDVPCGLAAAPDGSVYIADWMGHVVRKVDPAGTITTVAGDGGVEQRGDGPATQVSLQSPRGLALAADGSLYIADPLDHRVRKLTTDGFLVTVAGSGAQGYGGDGGKAYAARLDAPYGVAVQADGAIVIADTGNDVIRRVGTDGIIRTIAGGDEGYAGDGEPWLQAQFSTPVGLAVHAPSGTIFVADTFNQAVRRLDPDGIVRHVAGTGSLGFCGDGGEAATACLRNPQDVAVVGSDLAIADFSNLRVRVVRGVV